MCQKKCNKDDWELKSILNKYCHAKCMSTKVDKVVQLFPEDMVMCAILWHEIIVHQNDTVIFYCTKKCKVFVEIMPIQTRNLQANTGFTLAVTANYCGSFKKGTQLLFCSCTRMDVGLSHTTNLTGVSWFFINGLLPILIDRQTRNFLVLLLLELLF